MSSGRTHAAASLALATPTALCVGMATHNPLWGIAAGAGCLLGIPISPDLDIDHKTISEMMFPEPFRTLWFLWWLPYAKLLKHRSVWSHAPILGTSIRILYMFWWLPVFFDVPLISLWVVWLGLAISDTLHWMMDYV
jgi:uncharacterized metal-binding protein